MTNIYSGFAQLTVLFGPLILCVLVLQFIERQTQLRMNRHFGWRSNLWTGWIGAPVHEYSHAAVAWLFGHNIIQVVPFKPEKKSGRLGYVVINYNPKSLWQTVGHFFVCYAPLAGGTLAFFLLTLVFYPSALNHQFDVEPETLFNSSLTQAVHQLGSIVTLENMAHPKFWIYAYLVMSIGCHMAPSAIDYRSSLRSHGKVLLVLLIALPIFLFFGGLPASVLSAIAPLFLILQANFIFACLLCLTVLTVVYITTELMIWLS